MNETCAEATQLVKDKHSKEIEKSLKKLMAIRDSKELKNISCPKCGEKFDHNIPSATMTKNQIEANKWILRFLAPSKAIVDPQAGKQEINNLDTPLSKEEEKEMEKYLSGQVS